MLLQRLPLQRFNGPTKHLVAPSFSTAGEHVLLGKHLACRQRPCGMTFKDWLRAYRTDVACPHRYKVQKLTAVGASMASPWNPVFLEQRLLLNVLLVESDREVWATDAAQLPEDLQSMCCALEWAGSTWSSDELTRAELLLHGGTGGELGESGASFRCPTFPCARASVWPSLRTTRSTSSASSFSCLQSSACSSTAS